MKKILTLLTLVFIAFFANGQTDLGGTRTNWSDIRFIINENFDTIYNRVDSLDIIIITDTIKGNVFILSDSIVVAITEGDTLATIEKVRNTINDSLSVFVGSPWTNYGDSIEFSGKIITDTTIADGAIGIGTRHPLSALHLNKGVGSLATGISFGDGDAGFAELTDDLIAYYLAGGVAYSFGLGELSSQNTGGFEIGRADATAFIPSYYFRGDANTGLGRNTDDEGSLIAGGKEIARFSENVTEQFIINPQGDFTGTLASPNWSFGDGDTGGTELIDDELSLTANSIEAMRLTKDTIYIDSTMVGSRFELNDINNNVLIGKNAGQSNDGAFFNVFVGYKAGEATTTGDKNVFIGYNSGTGNVSGQTNVFMGYESGLINTTGSQSVFIGNESGYSNLGALRNTFIGNQSGRSVSSGGNNSFFGYQSGYSNVSGTNNTYIGHDAGRNATGSSNVFLGYLAGKSETGSSLLYIDNQDNSTPLIYGDFAADEITINGEFGIGISTLSHAFTVKPAANNIISIQASSSEEVFSITGNPNTPDLLIKLGDIAGVDDGQLITLDQVNSKVNFDNVVIIQENATIIDNDATPDVSGANIWTYNGTANVVVVTDLDNPDVGAIYRIIGNSDVFTITINDAGNFNLSGNWVGGIDDVLTIFVQADNDYIEISRSDN